MRGGARPMRPLLRMDYPDYDPTLADRPLSDDELQSLDDLLQELPGDDVMTIEAMDGYLAALVAGPPALLKELRTRDWLPLVWGGDAENGAPFASNKQRKRAAVLVLRHLHSIACALRDAPDGWEPIFSVAETEDAEFVDAEDWCIGFLRAVALRPAAWEPLFDDPALRPIVVLGGDESELSAGELAQLDDPAQREEISRAALAAASRVGKLWLSASPPCRNLVTRQLPSPTGWTNKLLSRSLMSPTSRGTRETAIAGPSQPS